MLENKNDQMTNWQDEKLAKLYTSLKVLELYKTNTNQWSSLKRIIYKKLL